MSLIHYVHPRWGRLIGQYPNSYTNDALSARLKTPIKICLLSEPTLEAAYKDIVGRITLSKLESILELTRFPSEYENLALPKLVAGCIELLSCVTPSPFTYEYGYLCFRTLVFALNTCLLKYGGVWKETIDLIGRAPPRHRLTCFWDQSAFLICDEILYHFGTEDLGVFTNSACSRRWSIPHFDPGKLDKLLSILHSDQKNFLFTLRNTGSMGLSTLLFILRVHVDNKRPTMSSSDFMEKALLPYCRVLNRYQVTLPDLGMERHVSSLLFARGLINKFHRSLYQLGLFTRRTGLVTIADFMLLTFVASYVVPGCEHLVPAMLEATMKVFWDTVLVGVERQALDKALCQALYVLCFTLNRLEPQVTSCRQIEKSWIFKLADRVIKSDVVGLILRLKLVKPIPEPDDLRVLGENEPYEPGTSIQQFLNLATLLPPQYLSRLLLQSGSLFDWWKYFISWYLSTAGASLVYYARLLRQSNFPDLSQAYRGANGGQYSPLLTA